MVPYFPQKTDQKSIYSLSENTNNNNIALNPNHTCFILVDDGSANNFCIETEFRNKLEITLKETLKIPILLIVIEGGLSMLKKIHDALNNMTPIILVAVKLDLFFNCILNNSRNFFL